MRRPAGGAEAPVTSTVIIVATLGADVGGRHGCVGGDDDDDAHRPCAF
jgi:hypothetical protein